MDEYTKLIDLESFADRQQLLGRQLGLPFPEKKSLQIQRTAEMVEAAAIKL